MDSRTVDILTRAYGIDERLVTLARTVRDRVARPWSKIDGITQYNQLKVLEAFHYARVSEVCLQPSSGYGYGDLGRERIEAVYSRVFRTQAALVRPQFVSGTHAIACALYGAVSSGKSLVFATGEPYDTLKPVIGDPTQPGTLAAQGVDIRILPLLSDGSVDLDALLDIVARMDVVVHLQRSCGYAWRPSLSLLDIQTLIENVRQANPYTTFIVDNCYGEFVEDSEPTEVGADLVCGSLIKNPGAGLCLSGGYLAGKRSLVERAAERLTCPGIGSHVGANPLGYRQVYQGIFQAPATVAQSIKGAVFMARFFEELGFEVSPHYAAPRTDIIQAIKLGSAKHILAFCRGIQRASAVDSFARPEAAEIPGYEDGVVMAGGTFVQGSSIELSADAPMREPYVVYVQGGLSCEHVILGALLAAHEMSKEDLIPVGAADMQQAPL